jgi:hypothetical protein
MDFRYARTFQGQSVVMEVSAMEKKAERPSKRARTKPCSFSSCRILSTVGQLPRSAAQPTPTAAPTAPDAPAPSPAAAAAPTASARRHHAEAIPPHASATATLTAAARWSGSSSASAPGRGAAVSRRGSAEAEMGASRVVLATPRGHRQEAEGERYGGLVGARSDWN